MIIDDNTAIANTLEEIALARSQSDSENFHLLDLLNRENPSLPLDKTDHYPDEEPFDICTDQSDKRRMLAAILAMIASTGAQKTDRNFFHQYDRKIHQYYRYMKELDASLFQQDPYLQKISLPLGKEGPFLFGFREYEKDKMFHYGEPVEDGYGDLMKLAWFRENVKYPSVTENGTYFTSLSADRILSAESLVRPVSQNVLVLGCDIGYLPYLLHRKDSVSSVTIVEHDLEVASLFEKEILPQFDYPEKIHVEVSDAYEYLQNTDHDYRWIIDDLYSSSTEGVFSYLSMKKLEHLHKRAKYAYWIEESVLSNLKSAMLVIAMSAAHPEISEESLLGDEEEGKQIVRALEPFTDHLHIRNNSQLKELFTSKGLRKFLTKQA